VFFRTWAIFVVAIKRLSSQKGLTLATLLGLVVAIALMLSIPLYADAVYYRVFREELLEMIFFPGSAAERSPFAFMFRYVGSWHGPVEWEDVQLVDEYFSGPVTSAFPSRLR
jgi:putative ABC transport system permease protein